MKSLIKAILDEKISDLKGIDLIKKRVEEASKIYFPILSEEMHNLVRNREKVNYNHLYWSTQLAAYCEDKKAFFLIKKILKLPIEIIDEFFGEEFITEDMRYILAYTAHDQWESLKEVIEDVSIDEFIRSSCMNALVIMVFKGQIDRLKVVNYFKEYLYGIISAKIDDDKIVNMLVDVCVDLYPEECLEEIKESFGLMLVDPLSMNIHDVYEILKTSKKKYLKDKKHSLKNYDFFQGLRQKNFDYKAYKEKNERWQKMTKQVDDKMNCNEEKIGRNDTCICGSGRKYKKCCLNKETETVDHIKIENCTITTDPLYNNIPEKEKKRISKIYHFLLEEKFQKVLEETEKGLRKHPNIKPYYNYRYCSLKELNRCREAMQCLRETVKKFPNYLFGKTEMAAYFLRRGEKEKVMEIFSNKYTLKQLYPEREEFHISEILSFFYIMCWYYIDSNDIKQAKIYLNGIKKMDPEVELIEILTNKIRQHFFRDFLEKNF